MKKFLSLVFIFILIIAFIFLVLPFFQLGGYGNCGVINKENFELCLTKNGAGCECLFNNISTCQLAHFQIIRSDLDHSESSMVFVNGFNVNGSCLVGLTSPYFEETGDKGIDCFIGVEKLKENSIIASELNKCFLDLNW